MVANVQVELAFLEGLLACEGAEVREGTAAAEGIAPEVRGTLGTRQQKLKSSVAPDAYLSAPSVFAIEINTR